MLLERPQPLVTECSKPWRAGIGLLIAMAVLGSASFIGVKRAAADDNPKQKEPAAAAEKQTQGGLADLTERQVGMVDKVMGDLLSKRDAIDTEIETMKGTGANQEHPKFKQLRDARAILQKQIDEYRTEWRDYQLKLREERKLGLVTNLAPTQLDLAAGLKREGTGGMAIGGVQIDLVNLANTLVDAAGAQRLAKVKFQRVAVGPVAQLEKDEAEVNLITAEKRLRLLRGIAEVALQSAQEDLSRNQDLYKKALISMQAVSESKSKVRMLELILKGGE